MKFSSGMAHDKKISDVELAFGFKAVDQHNKRAYMLHFGYNKNELSIVILCKNGIPNNFSRFVINEKLVYERSNDTSYWIYSSGEVYNPPFSLFKKERVKEIPLVRWHPRIRRCSPHEAASILHNKGILFYTGAGISSPVIPTLEDLYKGLRFDQSGKHHAQNCVKLIEQVLNDEAYYKEYMAHFFDTCINAESTPAHHAVAKLIKENGYLLCTENLDFLHEMTGIQPVKRKEFNPAFLKKHEDLLSKVEYIVTIGLAEDRSSFLSTLKSEYREIKILSFDLQPPAYLGTNEYLVEGDAQETVPAFVDALLRLKTS